MPGLPFRCLSSQEELTSSGLTPSRPKADKKGSRKKVLDPPQTCGNDGGQGLPRTAGFWELVPSKRPKKGVAGEQTVQTPFHGILLYTGTRIAIPLGHAS